MLATRPELSPREIAERGEALYADQIRPIVDKDENIGKLLTLNIRTGQWAIGTDRIELADALLASDPEAVLYTVRVGYPAASAIGAALIPFRDMSDEERRRFAAMRGETS